MVKSGPERLDLLEQTVDKLLARHNRVPGNIINWLFRVKLSALSARFWQNIDQMAFDIEKAKLEYREKPDRPSADDYYIRLDRFRHDSYAYFTNGWIRLF
jgi:hypothetical protein